MTSIHGRKAKDEAKVAAESSVQGLILAHSMGDPNAARQARKYAEAMGLPPETVANYLRYASLMNSIAFEDNCSGIFASRLPPSAYAESEN